MIELKNEKIAIPVVLLAGLIWSFGPLVVRYMDQPNLVPWQYIFARGLTIFLILNLYLFFEEGKDFYKNYLKIGISGIVGGTGLGIAMITFIYSITNTSPIKEFFSVLPKAIIIIPTVAINIATHTLTDIFSFKNKKPSNAVKKGIAAKQSKVTAALVFVIE